MLSRAAIINDVYNQKITHDIFIEKTLATKYAGRVSI
jgi:hypothetical protein